ncbi:MAG: hypothetical protein GY872_20590 [Roseibacillus sp.]|nr:hypothetical protein [Roseibacillus sp.]
MSEVKHYGVFQFKNGITEEQIENCFAEMKGMVGKSNLGFTILPSPPTTSPTK